MTASEPLFRSAHAALIFALNYSDQIYERPLMNRLAAPAPGSGKGLVGVDGAGQAGMIRAELKALGGLHENILVARLAPRQRYCECRGACCSGRKPNPEWVGAVSWLSEHVRVTALAGCLVDYRVRRNCVEIFFGKSLAVAALADDCGIARNTASAHLSRVRKRLKEDEHHAQVAIDDRLRQAGILI